MYNKTETVEEMEGFRAPSNGLVNIEPKKDFKIVTDLHNIEIFKGVKISVPKQYIQNLKTEGVI